MSVHVSISGRRVTITFLDTVSTLLEVRKLGIDPVETYVYFPDAIAAYRFPLF